jgi:hypothetical protein
MARRGLMTALQAALAGAAGAAGGYAQQQELERKRKMDEDERQRQALRDTLAREQFGLQQEEFKAKYGPEAIARAERQAELDRDAALARTTAAERMRQDEERRQSRLGGQAFFQQARQAGGGVGTQLIGNAIANEVVRRGRQLTQDEISDLSAAVMGNLMGERKMVAAEYAANVPTPEELAAARARAGGAAAGGSVARRAGAAAPVGPTQEERARAWMQMNPRRSDESTADYAARMRAAIGG